MPLPLLDQEYKVEHVVPWQIWQNCYVSWYKIESQQEKNIWSSWKVMTWHHYGLILLVDCDYSYLPPHKRDWRELFLHWFSTSSRMQCRRGVQKVGPLHVGDQPISQNMMLRLIWAIAMFPSDMIANPLVWQSLSSQFCLCESLCKDFHDTNFPLFSPCSKLSSEVSCSLAFFFPL